MRDLALDLMAQGEEAQFVPEVPYEKVYTNWLENLRDWTISRQLWWGHQIPAWYTKEGEVIVARSCEEAASQSRNRRVNPGPGRAGHVVFVRALALLDSGMAGRD